MRKNNFLKFIPHVVMLIVALILIRFSFMGGASQSYSYDYFVKNYQSLEIQNIDVNVRSVILKLDGQVKVDGKLRNFTVTLPNNQESFQIIDQISKSIPSSQKNAINYYDPSDRNFFWNLIASALPFGIIILISIFLFSRIGGANNKAFDFVKSKARRQNNVKTRFSDIAGAEEEKQEVSEIIDYLKNPGKYKSMGARVPKGILLEGPPGTGKTLLAKAVAGESKVPFFSISGSDFVEMFVGAGASRVRDMFKEAKKTGSCVIFIDEIDAVGRQRGAGHGGGHDEREQTLNQLLVEMDGMNENSGIVIMAATNRADILDSALLRSGRFDRRIQVSLPDKKAREEILRVHARNKRLASNVEMANIAKRTPGFSGADLENVLNEAAILAIRENRQVIELNDLDEAIDRVMMGPAKKSKKYSEEEKRLVAYHESGHAIIGIKLKDANKVQKITIIPRGDAGGYNLMMPEDERYFPTKKSLLAEITGFMGGRIAEELIFGEISAGAYDDIEKATRIAKLMVTAYGMSDLGPIQYASRNEHVFMGRGSGQDAYSQETAKLIDQKVKEIIESCYQEAKKLIEENKELLHLIAGTLIEEETITSEQIDNLVKYGSINPVLREEQEAAA